MAIITIEIIVYLFKNFFSFFKENYRKYVLSFYIRLHERMSWYHTVHDMVKAHLFKLQHYARLRVFDVFENKHYSGPKCEKLNCS